MTPAEILKAMAESETLADSVLIYLNEGMCDEWDTTLPNGLLQGLGGRELQLAARTGQMLAESDERAHAQARALLTGER